MKIEEIYREIIKIHSILDNYHNQLNANKEKFEKIYNETISSMTEIRNILLTIFTALIGLSGFSVAIQNTTDSTNTTDSPQLIKLILSPSMLFLIAVGVVGVSVYYLFYRLTRNQKKILLEILKEFHDGFTSISFMKSLLYRIPSRVNLEEAQAQLEALKNYYIMVTGGIAFKIRKEIEKSIQEEDVYGENEKDLYKMLICNASQRFKKQKKNENVEKEEEIIKYLFTDEKDDFNILKTILDEYKKQLKIESLLIDACVQNEDKKEGRKIVEIQDENVKFFIIVKGHGIYLNSISKRIKDWHKSWPNLKRRYKIQLKPEKIQFEPKKLQDWDWEYGNLVELEDIISKE